MTDRTLNINLLKNKNYEFHLSKISIMIIVEDKTDDLDFRVLKSKTF